MDYLAQAAALGTTQRQIIEEIFKKHKQSGVFYQGDDEPPTEAYDDPTNSGEEF